MISGLYCEENVSLVYFFQVEWFYWGICLVVPRIFPAVNGRK